MFQTEYNSFGSYTLDAEGYASRQREVGGVVREVLRSATGISDLRIFEREFYGSSLVALDCFPEHASIGHQHQARLYSAGVTFADAVNYLLAAVHFWRQPEAMQVAS